MSEEPSTPQPSAFRPPSWWSRQSSAVQGWVMLVVALVVIAMAGALAMTRGDDTDRPTSPAGKQRQVCPDYLEVAGPYRQGIDPEYRPAMDWDHDGVSCE